MLTQSKFLFPLVFITSLLCAETVTIKNAEVTVNFSPHGKTDETLTKKIASAQKSIDVAAYSFTSLKIAEKLVKAAENGIKVRVILDKSQRKEKHSVLKFLKDNGVNFRISSAYKIHHNKYMIFDAEHVQTGSYNYTKSAEIRNAENSVIISNASDLAKVYTKNFEKLWDESENE